MKEKEEKEEKRNMKATVKSRSFGDIRIEIADTGLIKYECHACIPQ